jgi:hypothetical protein
MDVVVFVSSAFAEFVEFEGEGEIAFGKEIGEVSLDSSEEFAADFRFLSFGAAGADFEIAMDEGVIGLAIGN